jgi:hypothetical protein
MSFSRKNCGKISGVLIHNSEGFTGSDPQESSEFSHLAMVSGSSVSTQPSLNGKVITVSV